MKVKLTLKTFLLFLILIPFGWVAFNLFEIDSIAKTDSQKLDRLFREMGVIKVTPVTPGARPVLSKCPQWKNCIRCLKTKILLWWR
jgi:hypothetical protein